MCSLAICMLHLQSPVWFSFGLSFHFSVSFFCGYKFFKDNLQFFLLNVCVCSLKHTLYVFLKLGLSPGWPGTWSKQFDCFTSQNAEFTGTSHHAWLKNSFNLGKLQIFFLPVYSKKPS